MNKLIKHVIDKFEELDWYHIGPTGELVHGANSEEDDALYRAKDVYKLLNDFYEGSRTDISETTLRLELDDYDDTDVFTVGGWIPCSKAKPPKSGLYLATERCGKVDIHYYNVDSGLWSIETVPKIVRKSYQVPVAWMEIVKPWEGAQND